MSTGINIDKSIKVVDETTPITDSASQLTFTGAGVTATGSGGNVTINIPGGSTGTVTNVTGVSPIASSGGNTPAISISDAVADGTTKGAATFTASDFSDNGSGVISLDYVNGQKASASQDGFLSQGDYSTFSGKQNTITGGASTITTSNLSPSFALQSNASGKVEVSTVTSTELGYVSGVTSSIQTQLNNKQNTLVNPVTGTGTSGQVSFWNGTNTQSGSNNFFWNNANGRLGINTATPQTALDVNGTIRVDNTSFTGNALTIAKTANNTTRITAGPGGTEYIQFGATNTITLNANGVSVSANLIIGTGIYAAIGGSTGLEINNTQLLATNQTRTGITLQNNAWGNVGAGGASTLNAVKITPTINHTLGTVTGTVLLLDPIINTTGGTHTIRGLYYNPTLTSTTGVTHRAIETTSGDVLFGTNFFWDNTNNALGLGASPLSTSRLDIRAKDGLSTSQSFRIGRSTDNATQFEVNGQGLTTINTSGSGSSNSFSVSFAAGNEIFRVQENNVIKFRTVYTFEDNVGLNFYGGNNITNAFLFSYLNTLNIGGASRNHVAYSGTVNLTSGTNTFNGLNINHSITGINGAPTNTLGLININPTINITNGTSTLRGIYYNPTLTSTIGVTNRAIETASGDVIFGSTSGNVAIGGTSFGTSANRVLAVYNGTAPASSTLTSFQMYSADVSGSGTASPHFRTENGNTIKLYQETAVTTAQGIANALTNLGVLASSTIPQSGYTLIFGHSSATFLANNTYDIGALTYAPPTNATSNSISRRFRVPKTGIVKKVSILTACGNQSSLSPSPTLRLNNFTTSTATTITTVNLYNNGGTGAFARNNVFSPSGGNIAVTEGDEINIQSVIPNWTTAPQIDNFILTLWIEET